MSATSGLSFYLSEAVSTAPQSLTYGFEVLSVDDLSVVGINTSNQRVSLVKDSDFTLNLDTKTVTCTSSAWSGLTKISQLSDSGTKIRIFRTTSVIPSIDFTSGAVLSESDLDTAYKQGLFAAQEMTEDAADTNAGLQSVTSGVIAAGAVTAPKIATNSISEDRIINLAVTNAKIADNAVNAAKIQNGTVGSAELAANCVTTAKIGANQVTTTQILNNAVTQAKVVKAGKANMEALTGSAGQSQGVVTPDVLRYSQFAPRAYGSLGMASDSDNSFAHSYNVASVSANTHERTVTFTTPLHSNADYVVLATITGAGAGFDAPSIVSKTASGFTIDFNNTDSSGRGIDFVVFGSTLAT